MTNYSSPACLGFELFGDLLLADYLHRTGLAGKTVFHCKTIPWFVSDTMPSDFHELLDLLEGSAKLSQHNVNCFETIVSRWRSYISDGSWVVTSHPFWCSFWAYRHLPDLAPGLYSELSSSQLLIFKGDLNYRKLVYDCKFPATTPFQLAIGEKLAQGPPLVALRTNKSDPCVGLKSGLESRLSDMFVDWRWSGKFAVLQYSQGRKQGKDARKVSLTQRVLDVCFQYETWTGN
uniref:Sugar phosphate phosphatase n=1 Tax=Spongospora subterranea TaxID=70186 RepID=A0A0H5RC13_9EUKA|eukprot:CRZ11578.1 hypothetical protein [Spongospora subterranea]